MSLQWQRLLLACATNTGEVASGAVSTMGVWPPEVGLQGQASNHLMLLRLRDVVVSDGEKAAESCQVGAEKMSESEPLMKHRN